MASQNRRFFRKCPRWSYKGFLESGEPDALGIAKRYLELQHKLNSEPRNERLATVTANRFDRNLAKELITSILHPYQTPLTVEALQGELAYLNFKIAYEKLQRFCNVLSDNATAEPCLNRFVNPYKTRLFVYCSSDFQVYPQLGDKVVELIRQRSRRFGVVVDFKLYRLNGKRYPVIQTDTSKYFVDPERLVIVERLEPFTKKAIRPKQKAHTLSYSLQG